MTVSDDKEEKGGEKGKNGPKIKKVSKESERIIKEITVRREGLLRSLADYDKNH